MPVRRRVRQSARARRLVRRAHRRVRSSSRRSGGWNDGLRVRRRSSQARPRSEQRPCIGPARRCTGSVAADNLGHPVGGLPVGIGRCRWVRPRPRPRRARSPLGLGESGVGRCERALDRLDRRSRNGTRSRSQSRSRTRSRSRIREAEAEAEAESESEAELGPIPAVLITPQRIRRRSAGPPTPLLSKEREVALLSSGRVDARIRTSPIDRPPAFTGDRGRVVEHLQCDPTELSFA